MGRIKLSKELLAQYLHDYSKFSKTWTPEKIAEVLGVSRRTVDNYIRAGKKEANQK